MIAAEALPPKPTFAPFTGLPALPALAMLQARKQWVVWDYRLNKGGTKWTKPPLRAADCTNASHSEPRTWAEYDRADYAARRNGLPGVGYVLTPDDDIGGFDIDGCRDAETGTLAPWAADVLALAETYAEISPSGRGVRIFALGKPEKASKCDPAGVEVYAKERFLTVTGRHIAGTPTEIRPAPRTLATLLARIEAITAAIEAEKEKIREAATTQAAGERSGVGAQFKRTAGAGTGATSTFFRDVNSAAFANLGAWVLVLFGSAAIPNTMGYRVSSAALGRALEEDLSITGQGAKDFGVGDMGDPKGGSRTAIDLAMEHGGAPDAVQAALWLCERLGVDPAALGWRGRQRQDAGGQASGARQDARGEQAEDDGFGPSDKAGAQAKPKEDPFPLIWHGDNDDAPLAEWLVEEMLPKVGTALLSGQWGTYKTFCGFDLSAAVMMGGTFAGRQVKRAGGVLWLAVEGQSEVRKRLAAVAQEKIAPAVDGETVKLDPERLPFVWVRACPKLSDEAALPALKALVGKAAAAMRERFDLDLSLVIIDTLSPAAEMQDANDTAEAQRVMTTLKRTAEHVGTVVLAVDHMGKDVSTGTRNSSVKEADVDAVLALLGEKDLAGNVANPRLAMRKVRGAPTGWEVKFDKRVVTVGTGFDAATTLVVDWATGEGVMTPEKPAKPMWSTSGERALKGCLERTIVEHGSEQQPYGRSGPKVRAVHLSRVRNAFMSEYAVDVDDRAKALDAKRKAFTRAREGAQRKGLLQTKEIGASLVDWIWLVREDEPTETGQAD